MKEAGSPQDCSASLERHRRSLMIYMYCSLPSERPPYFHARMARKRGGGGGGRINGSDRFSTRGAPPILISALRP